MGTRATELLSLKRQRDVRPRPRSIDDEPLRPRVSESPCPPCVCYKTLRRGKKKRVPSFRQMSGYRKPCLYLALRVRPCVPPDALRVRVYLELIDLLLGCCVCVCVCYYATKRATRLGLLLGPLRPPPYSGSSASIWGWAVACSRLQSLCVCAL